MTSRPTNPIAEIVDRLTDAQKRALLSAEWREACGAWQPAGWYVCADRRIRYRLCLAGVLEDYLSPTQRLTPLGIEVQQALREAASLARKGVGV